MVRAYGGRGRPALVTHSSAAAGSGEEVELGAVLVTAITLSPYDPAADLGTGAVHQPGAAGVGRVSPPPPASVAAVAAQDGGTRAAPAGWHIITKLCTARGPLTAARAAVLCSP
jgi:hypothetical protein